LSCIEFLLYIDPPPSTLLNDVSDMPALLIDLESSTLAKLVSDYPSSI